MTVYCILLCSVCGGGEACEMCVCVWVEGDVGALRMLYFYACIIVSFESVNIDFTNTILQKVNQF